MITHPEKVFWPEEGYTKQDLADFYERVFPKLQPYVDDRLLSLERCPDGMRGSCFYQKKKPAGMPEGTRTKLIQHADHDVCYVVGSSLETQLALVNLGCIAVHVWGSRASNPRKPDWVTFDIDPSSGEFADAARASLIVKKALDDLELVSFPKTSGSRGVHILVPIETGPDADQVLLFARTLCDRLAAEHPQQLTVEHSIKARKDRVYLDPFRNGFGATVVAPYSVRRRPKAPVSTPLAWSEVKPSLDPAQFNVGNFFKRRADPWKDFFKARQQLKPLPPFKASNHLL
jgi:bifunctional non-homologous end joining protein LigD